MFPLPLSPLSLHQMPSLSEVVSRRYYINLESDVGVFVNNRQINFYNNQFGHMLVKTDKPIYKPAQTGSCIYNIYHTYYYYTHSQDTLCSSVLYMCVGLVILAA